MGVGRAGREDRQEGESIKHQLTKMLMLCSVPEAFMGWPGNFIIISEIITAWALTKHD